MKTLKKYECVQANHHKDVGKTIEEWQKNGWRLHTYTCAQMRPGLEILHYLLFERENDKKMSPSVKAAAAAAAAAAT